MPGTATVIIGDSEWAVDVAVSAAELQAGLGGLESIPAGTGMLFDFGTEQAVVITTEPMLFDIDIIFIGQNHKVVDMEQNMAPGYIVEEETPVRYVLEVNAEEADDIEVGDNVQITDYEYTQPTGGLTEWMPSILQIAVLGFVMGMVSGMMRGMTGGSNPGHGPPKKLYGLKEEVEHGSYIILIDPATGEETQTYNAYPPDSPEAASSARWLKELMEKRKGRPLKVKIKPVEKLHHSDEEHITEEKLEKMAECLAKKSEVTGISPETLGTRLAEAEQPVFSWYKGRDRTRVLTGRATARRWLIDRAKEYGCMGPQSNPGPDTYVTITYPGKTTFKVGEVVCMRAFKKENARVEALGGKPAEGKVS